MQGLRCDVLAAHEGNADHKESVRSMHAGMETKCKGGGGMSWGARHKFGAQMVLHAGMSFMSRLEAAVYDMLWFRQKAGEIVEIKCQDHVKLSDAQIVYIVDFRVTPKVGNVYWVEAKGFQTPEWKLKKRLWTHYGPGLLEVWGGTHARPKLMETVVSNITNRFNQQSLDTNSVNKEKECENGQ